MSGEGLSRMVEQLSNTPLWFILFIVFIMSGIIVFLSGYFLWSIKNVFADLKLAIESLKNLIAQLYDKHNNHENRISIIEGTLLHRRDTDPKDVND